MALQKQDGGLGRILCGEIWRRCFASLAVTSTPVRNAAGKLFSRIPCGEIWRRCFASLAVTSTPVRNAAAKLFTCTYDNFIQTAGIRDGTLHCAKILSVFYDNLDTTSDLTDPEVMIKIDMSNAFNARRRALTLDVLSGHASRDYACGLNRNIGTLLNPHACPYPICLLTFTPCAHAALSYDTLTGTDRFT
jgi:hypothetical protein